MSESAWVTLTRLPIPGLEWVRDLIYFDGPLLSEFRSSAGDTYLFHWCDLEGGTNRWMAFRVSRAELVKYLYRQLTLRKLIDESQDGFVYIVDIGDNRKHQRVFWVSLGDVPDDFLPDPNSMLVFDGSREQAHSYAALIDKEWGVEDLASFPRRFIEVYTFLYLLADSEREPPRSTHMFSYNFEKGRGWTAGHFFRELQAQIPTNDRPGGVEEFRYSSPGFISLRMNPKLGATITAAVNRYTEDQSSILDSYKILYDFLHDNSALSDDDDDMEPFGPIAETGHDYLAVSRELCRRLGFVDWDRIYSACEQNLVAAAQVLLIYCRRLKTLAHYQAEGKVKLL